MSEQALQILSKPAINAADIEQAAQLLAGMVEDGLVSALETYVRFRALHDALAQALERIAPQAVEEAEMDVTRERQRFGVGVQVRPGRVTFDYSGDAVWDGLMAQERALAAQRKVREALLQAMTADLVDPQTGEFVPAARVKGVSRPVLALTFAKVKEG